MHGIGYAVKRSMYVIIDLHSVPGLAGKEAQYRPEFRSWGTGKNQEHGRVTDESQVHFYDKDQQVNNDVMVKAALDWIEQNPNRDAISALGLVSESSTTALRLSLTRF